jgi:hypothetical protein
MPDGSFNQAESPSYSRHPVIVTLSTDVAAACWVASTGVEAGVVGDTSGAGSIRTLTGSVGRDASFAITADGAGDASRARGAATAGVVEVAFAGTAGASGTPADRTAAFSVALSGDGDDHKMPTNAAHNTVPPRTRATGTFADAGLLSATTGGWDAVEVFALERAGVRRRAFFTRSEIFFSDSRRNLRSADSR